MNQIGPREVDQEARVESTAQSQGDLEKKQSCLHSVRMALCLDQ